jgi:tRNA threonylcarbamoyladenosine biosynthesis protein TsaB
MKVLGIDSSTDKLGIGLADTEKIIHEGMIETSREHASQIIGLIDNVLQTAAVPKNELTGLAVADGPGSFTGLRIGLAVAKGMAVALNIPMAGVSTFEVMAARILKEHEDFYLAAVVRKGEYYLCRIKADVDPRRNIELVDQATLPQRIGDVPIGIIGRIPEGWGELVKNPIGPEFLEISGGDIARIGAKRIKVGETVDPGELEPMYIALSQAEKKFGQ